MVGSRPHIGIILTGAYGDHRPLGCKARPAAALPLRCPGRIAAPVAAAQHGPPPWGRLGANGGIAFGPLAFSRRGVKPVTPPNKSWCPSVTSVPAKWELRPPHVTRSGCRITLAGLVPTQTWLLSKTRPIPSYSVAKSETLLGVDHFPIFRGERPPATKKKRI